MSVRLNWHGEAIADRIAAASLAAVGETAQAAAARARLSHPGWKNVTGATEDSIQAERPERVGRGARARFGSPLRHFVFLEIGERGRPGDHTLRRASDVEGGHLAERISAKLKGKL